MQRSAIALLKNVVFAFIVVVSGAAILLAILRATMSLVIVAACLAPLFVILVVLEKAAKRLGQTPTVKALQRRTADDNLRSALPAALVEAIPDELRVEFSKVLRHIHTVERQRSNAPGKTEYVVVFKNGYRVEFLDPAREFVAKCVLCHDLPPV